MGFNRNIYMRLFQIAFFMSDVLVKGNNGINAPQDEQNEPYYQYEGFQKNFIESMSIKKFECKLFSVCMTIYSNLQPLFFPFQEKFQSRIEDEPERFFESIPINAISPKEIKEKSYKLFPSVKNACYFYCKFNYSYWLYSFSKIINSNKSKLKFMKYIKNSLYVLFSNRPIEYSSELSVALEDLSESIKALSDLNLSEPSQSLSLDSYDEVVVACLQFYELISNNIKMSKDIKDGEKQRRNAISRTKQRNNEKRRVLIQSHVDAINEKSMATGRTKKDICKNVHFPQNKQELESYGIKTWESLYNRVTQKEPNKQRSAFSNKAYITPVYTPNFEYKINKLYQKLNK